MSECSWDYDYKEPKEDNVNHPKHYKLGNGLETIDILEAVTVNLQGIEAVGIGNVLVYLSIF